MSNVDVESLKLSGDKIPNELNIWFPKFTKLIADKLLQISRSDFADLKQLRILEISVDFLPVNVFDDLIKLQRLTMKDSIRLFPPMVFHKLLQLEVVEVKIEFLELGKMIELPANLFQNNLNMKEISFHNNGLTCIRDGLLDGLNILSKVSFKECVVDNYPKVSLSVLKDQIHEKCQKCDVVIPVPGIFPPKPSPDAPKPSPVVGPVVIQPSPAVQPVIYQPQVGPCWIPPKESNSCTRELTQLQSNYNKLKAQKDCKHNIELFFKHNQN
ncbi:unnamed protein product [Diamesa hyperborea]